MRNLAYNTKQGSRVSSLAQIGFAAFDKGIQLINTRTEVVVAKNLNGQEERLGTSL